MRMEEQTMTKKIKPTQNHVLAGFALAALLGVLIAGCSFPSSVIPDAKCAACTEGSCANEFKACEPNARCECLSRCYSREQPAVAAGTYCPNTCGRSNGIYTALASCLDAHCAEVCPHHGM